jgi:hypothetical protein
MLVELTGESRFIIYTNLFAKVNGVEPVYLITGFDFVFHDILMIESNLTELHQTSSRVSRFIYNL